MLDLLVTLVSGSWTLALALLWPPAPGSSLYHD